MEGVVGSAHFIRMSVRTQATERKETGEIGTQERSERGREGKKELESSVKTYPALVQQFTFVHGSSSWLVL